MKKPQPSAAPNPKFTKQIFTYMKEQFYKFFLALLTLCFVGTAGVAYADGFEASTAESPKWYLLVSARPASQNVVTSQGTGSKVTGSAYTANNEKQWWRLEARDNESTYNIVNKDGGYLDPTQTTTNSQSQNAFVLQSSAPSTGWTVKSTTYNNETWYIITASSNVQLHQGSTQWSGGDLINYGNGSNTSDVGCVFKFEDAENPSSYSIGSATTSSGSQTFGVGNENQLLFAATVTTSGVVGTLPTVNGLTVNFSSESTAVASDLKNVKVYHSASVTNNFYSNLSSLTTCGTADISTLSDGSITINFNDAVSLAQGNNYFFVASDVTDNATVGNYIDASLASLTYNTSSTFSVNSNPTGKACIYPVQSLPYKPGDEGASFWRIPAMVTLKHQTDKTKNGRVVTIADNRLNHNGDLPNFTSLYETHSEDNGKTWSTKQCVAGTDDDKNLVSTGNKGFGDAALVETASGKLICVMAAGTGFNGSTADAHGEVFYITSSDGGENWTDPTSLTDLIFTQTTYSEGTIAGTFAASGRGLLLQRQTGDNASANGRVLFALTNKITNASHQAYILYSDDEGATWKVNSQSAYSGSDESKLVELKDGTVMISVRQSGNRGFNTSKDGGLTWGTQYTNSGIWGNACNGDILYYDKRVLFHSYVNHASRQNLTVAVSYDGGQTWPTKRVICEPSSCYSTMDIAADGDLCLFYEDSSCSNGFNLNFVKFPTSFLYTADPAKEAYDAALASANALIAKEGYESTALASAGQYSQQSLDDLKAVTEKEITEAYDYDAAATAIEEAITKVKESAIVSIEGYTSDVYFTISSKENCTANSSSPMYVSSTGTVAATASDAAQWQFIASTTTTGQVYIKLKDTETYLQRSGSALAVSSTPLAWTLTHDETNDCYFIHAEHGQGSYIVIDITSATSSFNFWNSTAGNSQWSTKFVLTPVAKEGVSSDTHAAYAVSFTNGPSDAYITVTESDSHTETAKDGGVLFLTSDEANALTASNVVVSEDYTPAVTVSTDSKTVTVSFTRSPMADMKDALSAAKSVIAKTGVGYPTADAAARTTLQAAIDKAAALTSPTADDVTTLTTATTTYKGTTSDIQLPENGKAYTITAVTKAGLKAYMNYASSTAGYGLVATTDADNSNYPMTAKLICHKVSDTEFVFLNNDGKYFVWKGTNASSSGALNSNLGFTDSYASGYSFKIVQLLTSGSQVSETNQANLFGYVAAQSNLTRSGRSDKGYFVIKNQTNYDQAGDAYYNDNFTSALLIEETDYPNTPTFIAAEGISGVDSIATFSAPFATIVPENSAAYYVTQETDADGTTIAATTMIAEGEAIPANEGVILLKDAGDTQPVTMVPVASETVASISSNLLGNSAGAEKTIAESDCAYVLAKANSLVAFYHAKVGTTLKINRAYLKHSNGASSIALRFGGETTNISSALTDTTDGAPVYDLSGRRIAQPTKGGVYIRGGKKYIK